MNESTLWTLSNSCDPNARILADRRYNRQKPGTRRFAPPGRRLVLLAKDRTAFWVTSWPFAEYVKHAWPGAWVCSAFRNEGETLSSTLIREAVSISRWRWSETPSQGMITFVTAEKVRPKRDFGRCFLRAGFVPVGKTKEGLLAFQMLPDAMPEALSPARGLILQEFQNA